MKRELNWNADCWKFAASQLCELAEILPISVGGHCIKFLKYIRTSYHWFQKMAHIHWSAEHSICFMIRCSCSRINVHVLIQWYSSCFSTFPTSFHLLDQITLYVTMFTFNFYVHWLPFKPKFNVYWTIFFNVRSVLFNATQVQTSSTSIPCLQRSSPGALIRSPWLEHLTGDL